MYLCYIDESGTPDVPGNTSHFVLSGLSIPIWRWKDCDREIEAIKTRYDLIGSEIHIAWILRPYYEQKVIVDFESLNYKQRRLQVNSFRNAELLRLQRSGKPKLYKQARKNFRNTECYVHLTFEERKRLILDVTRCISQWGYARLFAECIDKIHYNRYKCTKTIGEQSFEQIVSRFEQYLQIISANESAHYFGLLIHDNNETVAKKHTNLMKQFHQQGTLWTKIEHIIETPLFVDSQLTSIVQVADVCSYALRRYLENHEEELFDLIFQRADRKNDIVVGVRHWANKECVCRICSSHKKPVL
jgi:hypothetical protein